MFLDAFLNAIAGHIVNRAGEIPAHIMRLGRGELSPMKGHAMRDVDWQ
jgi:hypothetical protein